VLPDIPDNDTDTCWAPGCKDPVARWTESGLCLLHRKAIVGMDIDHPTGRLFDLLGMRLNVLQASGGACLRSDEPCDLQSCRFHLNDHKDGRSHSFAEPCAIKMANRGGMTLDEIAVCLSGVTRERARQLEMSGLRSLRRACEKAGIRLEDLVGFRAKDAA
jgi:hypothetical protein